MSSLCEKLELPIFILFSRESQKTPEKPAPERNKNSYHLIRHCRFQNGPCLGARNDPQQHPKTILGGHRINDRVDSQKQISTCLSQSPCNFHVDKFPRASDMLAQRIAKLDIPRRTPAGFPFSYLITTRSHEEAHTYFPIAMTD